ncbi:hypothetical protein [Desulfopila aestuarii]|uniref:Uncharacterized protein n=1 Tax=Desulfopila aestuarii DSM 18488 TaxID=1121416 RepID=A0A1M7Y7J2_9BACT|nr:hypothetical protein [Desulfopila aestuarii]SHO48551.1 hypothetical protein SAMN02745220_02362 [Desulfopila aestuarii DSM 18488]
MTTPKQTTRGHCFHIHSANDKLLEKHYADYRYRSIEMVQAAENMSTGRQKSTVKADIGKNRLIFTFRGWLVKKDLDSLYTDVRFCVADLKPGFHVITDLTDSTFGSLNCLSTFRKIMGFLMEKKAGQVVRVTRESSLIHKQIMNFSARLQGYKPIYVGTLAEAERVLADQNSSKSLRFLLHQTPTHFSASGVKETGYIREISIIDCIIEFFSSELHIGQSIVLEFTFAQKDGSSQSFEIPSKITAIEHDHFTAEFVDITEEQQQQLNACLIREAQKEPE